MYSVAYLDVKRHVYRSTYLKTSDNDFNNESDMKDAITKFTLEPSLSIRWSGKVTRGTFFPFNKNYRFNVVVVKMLLLLLLFKFSECSRVEWNASDRYPGFVVTCPATQGMLGDHLLCLKMADFLNIFAALI